MVGVDRTHPLFRIIKSLINVKGLVLGSHNRASPLDMLRGPGPGPCPATGCSNLKCQYQIPHTRYQIPNSKYPNYYNERGNVIRTLEGRLLRLGNGTHGGTGRRQQKKPNEASVVVVVPMLMML